MCDRLQWLPSLFVILFYVRRKIKLTCASARIHRTSNVGGVLIGKEYFAAKILLEAMMCTTDERFEII